MSEMPTVDKALDHYRTLIEESDEAVPMLLFSHHGQTQIVAFAGMPAGGLQQMLRTFLSALALRGGLDWAVLSHEAWVRTYTELAEAEKLRPGDLNRAAEQGEKVQEAASIVAVSKTGAFMMLAPFERKDGKVTWYPESNHLAKDAEVGGAIADILRRAVR